MKKQQHKFITEKLSYNGMTISKCTREDNGTTHYEVGYLVLSTLRKAQIVVDELKLLIERDKTNGTV